MSFEHAHAFKVNLSSRTADDELENSGMIEIALELVENAMQHD